MTPIRTKPPLTHVALWLPEPRPRPPPLGSARRSGPAPAAPTLLTTPANNQAVRSQLANRLAGSGAITRLEARDLSQGRVSFTDMDAAKSIAARLKHTPQAQVAAQLQQAIAQAGASQSKAATLAETAIDLVRMYPKALKKFADDLGVLKHIR